VQNAFELYYDPNPFVKMRGVQVLKTYYAELWNNTGLVKRGHKRAQKYNSNVQTVVGDGAISVFYEQLATSLPKGVIVSVGEGLASKADRFAGKYSKFCRDG
jgi:hypothetical protein